MFGALDWKDFYSRDRDMQLFNWPNLISLARLLSAPLVFNLILTGRFRFAFWVFLGAAISDGVDGFLARHLKSRTEVGSILDPLADKTLLIGCYLALGICGVIPSWLVTVVIFRDVMIIGGAIFLFVLDKPIEMNPLWISKVSTACQIGFVVLILTQAAFQFPLDQQVICVSQWVVGALTMGSGGGYVLVWVRTMLKPSGSSL